MLCGLSTLMRAFQMFKCLRGNLANKLRLGKQILPTIRSQLLSLLQWKYINANKYQPVSVLPLYTSLCWIGAIFSLSAITFLTVEILSVSSTLENKEDFILLIDVVLFEIKYYNKILQGTKRKGIVYNLRIQYPQIKNIPGKAKTWQCSLWVIPLTPLLIVFSFTVLFILTSVVHHNTSTYHLMKTIIFIIKESSYMYNGSCHCTWRTMDNSWAHCSLFE